MLEIATSKYMQVSHRVPSSQLVGMLAFSAVFGCSTPARGMFLKHNTKFENSIAKNVNY